MTEIGRCRDCTWWSRGSGLDWETPGWGYCELGEMREDGYPETGYIRSRLHEQTKALAVTSTPWQGDARLHTAPDFGCVQFEVKA